MANMKEEYEIDPNSSFNKLKKLQKTLKEDNAYKETFNRNKEEIVKKIETQCYQYYTNKIKLQEIYDKEQDKLKAQATSVSELQYELAENAQVELSQCLDPLTKLLFSFRNNNRILLDFLKVVEPSTYDELANFICHFFYHDIYNPNFDGGAFLTLIYHLLDEEIDKIKENPTGNFLDASVSFISKLLKSLTRREDVKKYLNDVLSELIIEIEGLVANSVGEGNEKKKTDFISLDTNKIKQYVKDNLKMKSKKKIEDFKSFLTEGITVCNVFNLLNKGVRKKQYKEKSSMFYEEESIDPIEVNLFGKSFENPDEEETEEIYPTLEQYVNNYFESAGNNEKKKSDFSSSQYVELNRGNLEAKMKIEKSENLRQYYKKQIDKMEGDKDAYSCVKFFSELSSKDSLEKIILVYQYSVETTKRYIDKLFASFLMHKDEIPNIIKYVCVIIDKLLDIKFPKMSIIEKNVFISDFFFGDVIFPILNNPGFNGLFLHSYNYSKINKENLVILTKILKKFLKGNFFNSGMPNEVMYTILNSYFIELEPCLITLFDSLRNVELPSFIDRLIQKKKSGQVLTDEELDFDYLKENPEADFEFQSMCISWKEVWLFYETIKNKESTLIKNQNTMFYKTYNKISYHEKTLKKKIADNEEKNKKSYIFLCQTRYTDALKEKLFPKVVKHSFESGDDNMKLQETEKFVLNKVKYSIGIIISHLNPLTRANFFVDDGNESTENFVKGLNKMIELEGFAEMLKDQTIPLEWFGLYLQSNIENIPFTHKRSNYSYLYQELSEESEQKLQKNKQENILSHMHKKIKNAEYFTKVLENSIKQMKKTKQNFDVLEFINNAKVRVTMKVLNSLDTFEGLLIDDASKISQASLRSSKKKNFDTLCESIVEFVDIFPYLSQQLSELDVLTFENTTKIPNSLETYFGIMFEAIKSQDFLKNYDVEDLHVIKIQIENYIHRRIYKKLFPEMASKQDITLFKICFLHSWISLDNYDERFKGMDKNILELAIQSVKLMDFAKSPFDKLKCFAKASEILRNYLLLSEGIVGEELLTKLQLYVIMNATLNRLSSNVIYIEMFLSADQKSDSFLKLLEKLSLLISSVNQLNHKVFVGITEEEYNQKINQIQAGD